MNKLDGTTHWEGCAKEGGPAHYDCAVASIAQLEAALREARRWIGDGDMGDEMDREIWTPAYCAVVDLVDAALGPTLETASKPSFSGWIQGPCNNCGKLSTEHPQPMMECPTENRLGKP
jgi:hypothetical protein